MSVYIHITHSFDNSIKNRIREHISRFLVNVKSIYLLLNKNKYVYIYMCTTQNA